MARANAGPDSCGELERRPRYGLCLSYGVSDANCPEINMRITARLDDETERYLKKIKSIKNLETITDVLKFSLREAAEHLEQGARPGDKMKALL
ncbi:MAG TPA: hypothetical protein ENK26_12890, partial [Gammaproteobacteria bacterium]|nr:hypothetical protein [Gammaproteobacteria bacterium]